MSAELLVNVTPQETRIAVIENGMLQEIFVERTRKRGLVGNIYKGRVSRVLPGMQAAFVDIGLDRAAFLHASDATPWPRRGPVAPAAVEPLRPGEEEPATLPSRPTLPLQPGTEPRQDSAADLPTGLRSEIGPRGGPGVGTGSHAPEHESISQLLSEGQSVVVQVIKDPIGTKGARLTTHLSIPSCYLVYVPDGHGVGVSQRIENDAERERLRTTVEAIALAGQPRSGVRAVGDVSPSPHVDPSAPARGGFIVRTAAELVPKDKLAGDVQFLRQLWDSIAEDARTCAAPGLVHADLPLVVRTLRELIGTEIEKVRIDSRESYRWVMDFVQQFSPELGPRIEHYPGERPIFDLYSVEDEIQKSLERKVQLKSGGYLILDQTEAMTTADVNTGAYVGRRNLEETIFKTNLEAAQAIARQLRLRNLGGIIIIDFIDMHSEEHKRQVLRALEKSLERDHTKTQISEVSALGLVQMTRKRTRESLEHVLCEPCPNCNGRGFVKSPETVCYEIFREILREARQYDAQQLLVLASQEVVDRLVDEESASFAELEAFIARPIRLQIEPMYTQAQYDVVLL